MCIRDSADLVLKGGRVFDLITGDLVETDVAICGDTIVGVFGHYSGKREIDVSGRGLVPGFIDTHLHVESSLAVSYTHLRAHETVLDIVCRLMLENTKNTHKPPTG